MKLTGIMNSSATYERLLAGETEGVEGWDQFVHVANQTANGESASRGSESRAQKDQFVRSYVAGFIQQGRKQTALGAAAMWGHAPLVRELLASGCDVNGSEEPHSDEEPRGVTALMRATSPEVVRILLKAGADANACDSRGRTPLLFCLGALHSESVYLKMVQDLLAAGADPTVNRGMSAMGWARLRKSRKLEELLEAAIVEWRRKSDSQGR